MGDMKFFVVIALAGAAVASPSNRNDDDGAPAALECTAGTNIGDKLANAFSSCFGSPSNDEQCYSYDEIMQWVEEEYADDACVLQSIGWMGNDFEFDEDQIEADVMSLDPVVTAPLFAGHEDCVDQVMDYVEDHECANTFSEEEANSLLDTAEKIAQYECFLHLFEQGCMDFLSSTAAGRR